MTSSQIIKYQHRKLKKRKILQRAIAILIGGIIAAVGLEIFLVPNSVIDGGITGISIMLAHLTGIPLGVFIFLLNLPFIFIGRKQIGKTFAFSTLFGIAVLSFFTALFTPVPAFTQDILLATIFGGIVIGIGVGLVIKFGGAMDGTEILAILINKKFPFSVGEIIMFINVFILAIAGFVFNWNRAMYSIIAYIIATKTIDVVVQGLDQSKSVYIISDNYKEIGIIVILLIHAFIFPPNFTTIAGESLQNIKNMLVKKLEGLAVWLENGATNKDYFIAEMDGMVWSKLQDAFQDISKAENSMRFNPFRSKSSLELKLIKQKLTILRKEYTIIERFYEIILQWNEEKTMTKEEIQYWSSTFIFLGDALKNWTAEETLSVLDNSSIYHEHLKMDATRFLQILKT